MKVTFELWQLITLALALAGSFAGLGKLLLIQFERNVRADIQRISADSDKWRELELKFYQHLAELPVGYVRREDYVRGQGFIESKLDAIAGKIEKIQMTQGSAK